MNDFVFSHAIEIKRKIVKIQLRFSSVRGPRAISSISLWSSRINQQQQTKMSVRSFTMRYIFSDIIVRCHRAHPGNDAIAKAKSDFITFH